MPAPPAPATAIDAELADDLDLTVVAPRRTPQFEWTLIPAEGERIVLQQYAVVGRRPAAPSGFPAAQIIALADPEKMLSKTHALIEVGQGSAWVTDLGSTNGTEIVEGDTTRECPPDERIAIPAGARLLFGGLEVQLHRGDIA